ncbi:hypothetical protein OC842_005622 [Tilletia horrida]|uniref:FUN14 domain-containing protein n=1 Tax=Tilletia horrida TaxID=155126 RepID=A0AAN6G7L6_9BASI|nr:hypothetical protein OC842_005622 [Tilletia horrida]
MLVSTASHSACAGLAPLRRSFLALPQQQQQQRGLLAASSSFWSPALVSSSSRSTPAPAPSPAPARALSTVTAPRAQRLLAASASAAPPSTTSPILRAVAAAQQQKYHSSSTSSNTPITATATASRSSTGDHAPLALAAAGAALILYLTSAHTGPAQIHCESLINNNIPTSNADPKSLNNPLNPDSKYPKSEVNLYQLSFGTITGICAGVFIKKGLKAVAFLLGAGYVLLQYLSSQRLVNVNWNAIGKTYDRFVDRAAGETGVSSASVRGWKGSKLQRIWNRLVDFLTADFQPRATFLAGLVLGFRLG